MDSCCVEAEAFAAEAEVCAELAASCDPALEACCRRDLEEQAVVARLKAQLSIHDRSKERLRAAQRVLGTAPAAPSQPTSGSDLETDEDDGQLARLQAQRLQQLQRAAQHESRLRQEGHGDVVDVPEARLLKAAEASAAPVVCHLAFEGSPLDDELDEHLVALAHQYIGTRFVRTRISLRSTLHLKLRTPPGPGLLCFRDGSLVGAASLDRFGAPECILEEAVNKWLRQLKVLQAANTADRPAHGSAAQDGDSSGSGSEDDEGGGGEWQDPCEVCGRRYPHQHIRSVTATRGSDSDSE